MSGSPRRMFAALVAGSLVILAGAAEPFRYPEGKHGTGELRYIGGVPVLSVAGPPEEIGEAVGVLAVRPGRRMACYPEDLIKHYHLRPLWGPIVAAGKRMVEHFPDNYRREFEAMAKCSGVDRERLVAGNTLFDVKKLLACSALLVEAGRSASGSPLLGRNLDYPSLGYAHEYSLVTIYRPNGARHAFASVGFPGLVGCLSGMNDAGLAVAILEVFQVKLGKRWFDAGGIPYALCYRRILEECSTIAEAFDLLTQMRRTTTTNLVVADREGIAVFEVTPDHVRVRRAVQGACICTNHFCTEDLRPWLPINLYQTFDRFQALDQVQLSRNQLGIDDLHHALDAARNDDETMQTMVFEPATLRMHLGIGTCPSSAADFKVLELAPLLKGLER